jgi:hypothetical protein
MDAEREFDQLRAQAHRTEAEDDRLWTLEKEIAQTAPATLAGAAIKLRRLGDAEIGIEAGPTPEDPGSVRKVLEVVDGLLGKADADQFLAAEREVAEADRLGERAVAKGWTDEALEPINSRYDAAADFIDGTEPRSLVAAVVKLRRLLDTGCSPLAGYDVQMDSLCQVVAFMERAIGAADDQAPPEPDVTAVADQSEACGLQGATAAERAFAEFIHSLGPEEDPEVIGFGEPDPRP